MAQAPNTPDFNGTWELNRSENLDNYLKAEGWGYLKRKAAALASATQIIKHVDNTLTIVIRNPRGKVEYEFAAAPKKEEAETASYKDVDGTDMTVQAFWNEDRTQLTEFTLKGADKKQITMVRYIKGDEMYLELINKDGVKCIRIFKKSN